MAPRIRVLTGSAALPPIYYGRASSLSELGKPVFRILSVPKNILFKNTNIYVLTVYAVIIQFKKMPPKSENRINQKIAHHRKVTTVAVILFSLYKKAQRSANKWRGDTY